MDHTSDFMQKCPKSWAHSFEHNQEIIMQNAQSMQIW
jgi:hypothetical protein